MSIHDHILVKSFVVCAFLSQLLTAQILSSTNYTSGCSDLDLPNGWIQYPDPTNHGPIIQYHCDHGYVLEGPGVRTCLQSGLWEPGLDMKSVCIYDKVKLMCEPAKAQGGHFLGGARKFGFDDMAEVMCESGEQLYLVCKGGVWVYRDGHPYSYLTACHKIQCNQPPQIPNAEWLSYENAGFYEGTRVTYQCFNGYRMVGGSGTSESYTTYLTCHGGQWAGQLPTCILNIHCRRPEVITNGHWVLVGSKGTSSPISYSDTSYSIGTTINYECEVGYKLLGEGGQECMSGGVWSHMKPQCIPYTDVSVYCDNPHSVKHGKCSCSDHDLSFCQPFYPGVKVICGCLAGYNIRGGNTMTCQADGSWSGALPLCDKDTIEQPQPFHVSTLAIVVATACSILGVLLFVMVLVVFRRHKPRARLYPGTPAPPPYTRVHNSSVSDHDRMALISCDARRFPLPSYEEATSATLANSGPPSTMGLPYRPLPPIPSALRGALPPNTGAPTDPRHEVFGSRDTVNVSMSDATSVTVETFDSAASNPSMSSRRVHTGSLHSTSTCSIVTEDVPLLDGNHNDGRVSQEPAENIEEIKDDDHT